MTKSKLALTSALLGILAVLNFFQQYLAILGIPAIVLGHMSLRRIKRDPELEGKCYAILGMGIGYFLVIGMIIIIALHALGIMAEF